MDARVSGGADIGDKLIIIGTKQTSEGDILITANGLEIPVPPAAEEQVSEENGRAANKTVKSEKI